MTTVNSNFLDICVLEWCKLFGRDREVHHWSNIVDDPAKYGPALLDALRMDDAQFEMYQKTMLKLRDKFIAHLDKERQMDTGKEIHI